MPPINVTISNTAEQEIVGLPQDIKGALDDLIRRLSEGDPNTLSVTVRVPLEDSDSNIRMAAIRDYRIVFQLDAEHRSITILTITRRSLLEHIFST